MSLALTSSQKQANALDRDPASARALFQSFQRTSLEEPRPPLWDYLLLESHPTLIQRIAMAERWRATTRRRGGAAPRAGS